jgi:hypothetical protein
MSYIRVIPRDLFNEANLLKCYGQLYLKLETANAPWAELQYDGEPFNIQQDIDDGSLTIFNVELWVRGRRYPLRRPLNSRAVWPLYLVFDDDGEDMPVFDREGNFTPEMVEFISY